MRSDRERLEACFDAHYQPVLRFLRRRLEVPEDAEDAATEVFAVACRRIERVPPEPDTVLWLYAVARNVLANHKRAARRRGALHARLIHHLSEVTDPIAARDTADAVLAAFRSLRAGDRELLSLVAWEGLGAGEIAVVLGLPRPVVSARLYRARGRLASLLMSAEVHRAAPARIGAEHA